VGVLGGSFNPPHLGHLALARHAARELGLERVLLIPVCEPPHKPVSADDPGPEHRLEMCRLLALEAAAAQEPPLAPAAAGRRLARIEVSPIEIERGGRSYTVETLRELGERVGGQRLTLIVGAEMALTLPSWREPEEIVRRARIAVADRTAPADGIPPRAQVAAAVHGIAPEAEIAFLEMEPVPVSSTLVRARLGQGEPVAELVGDAVAAYIERFGLYRTAVGASA
jgi:nicotinate-nucleotide adenylyltransferase